MLSLDSTLGMNCVLVQMLCNSTEVSSILWGNTPGQRLFDLQFSSFFPNSLEMAKSPAAFAIVSAATVFLCSFNFFSLLRYPSTSPPLHSGSLLPHYVRHLYKRREPLPGTGYHLHSNKSITHTHKIHYKTNKRSFSVASISKNDLNFHKTMFVKLLTPWGHV